MSVLDTASLIVTPNAYKEGKLYSVIPSDGSGDLSVTRATTATRVNSAGLVELVPYNLFNYSQNFTTANWQKISSSTITANTTTAPDGTLTASTYKASNQVYGRILRQGFLGFTIGSYSISVYVKKSNFPRIGLRIANSIAATDRYPFYNFDTDTFNTLGISGVTMSRDLLSNGWVRINLTYNISSISSPADIALVDTDGSVATALTGNEEVYVWGAQLVEGSTAKDYQRTETRLNIPRLDYSLGSCSSLLVEPQRTNLVTDSETYSSTWGSNFTSITKNLLSPSGITNASTMVNSVGANRSIFKAISVVSGNTYQFSFYIKKISGAFVNSSAIQLTSWGPAVAAQTYTNIGTILTNDWVRYTHTFTATSTNTVFIQFISNEIHTFGLWGAQLEAGAFPTSYIPTTTASVTRNRDEFSKTGISSLIGQSEGTLFFNGNYKDLSSSRFITITNGTNSNVIQFYVAANSTNLRGYIAINGSVIFDDTITSLVSINQFLKIAIAYKSGDTKIYFNGTPLISINTTYSTGVFDRLNFASQTNSFRFEGLVQSVSLWKTRLTNAELAALTTL